jgi:hypothetical protein
MYKPVKTRRYFNRKQRYSAIDWNDEKQVIKAFRQQVIDWYIRPTQVLIRTPHAAFAVLAHTCILIDALSQYEAGSSGGSGAVFKGWLLKHFKRLGRTFPTPIRATVRGTPTPLTNYAEVIYNGVRCGILHEAHVALYGGITGQKQAVSYQKKGWTTYTDLSDCPTVVIHPKLLFKRVKKEFEAYFKHLLDPDPQWQWLRDNFKKKFLSSYGITIGNEP